MEEALEKCKVDSERNIWVYLEIKTKEIISTEHIKEMKRNRRDIVSIQPILEGIEREEDLVESLREKSMGELFKEYFIKEKAGLEPSKEIMELFLSIALDEEDSKNETS